VVLWGMTGTGKTHLLAAAFNALLAAGKVPCYCVVPLLLDHVREGYDAGDYGERFRTVLDAPILLLDDLGAEKRTDWTDEALFKLLDYRYRHELPTAIGSNLPPDDLEERISSRLQDGALSVVVRMRGPDHRRTRKRAAG
jgi:DNA replication protein DnaC